MSEGDIRAAIAPHLPYLRRFARALTGSQESGDTFTVATLETLIADRSIFDTSVPPKIALFKVFHAVWASFGTGESDRKLVGTAVEAAAQKRLAKLPPRSREALLLGALEDFTTGEVATVLGVSTGEVVMLQKSARNEIRNQTAARVLIIEDEPIIALDIESIVTELGHDSIGIADTREEAVDMAQSERPDLILSDIKLADGSSGVDAAHEILAKYPVPIIFITAYPERLLTGKRPEPTFLITKPFKRAAVEAAISQALFFGSAALIEV